MSLHCLVGLEHSSQLAYVRLGCAQCSGTVVSIWAHTNSKPSKHIPESCFCQIAVATDLSCLLTLLPGQAVGQTWFPCLWCEGVIVCIPDEVEASVTSGVVATIEFSVHKPFVLGRPQKATHWWWCIGSGIYPHNASVYNVVVLFLQFKEKPSFLIPFCCLVMKFSDLLSQVDLYIVAGLFKLQWIPHSWSLIISCNLECLSLLLFTTPALFRAPIEG